MRRSQRLAAMTRLLVDSPNAVISLSRFVDRFHAAKSTVSEDLAIIKEVFRQQGLGRIETITGAAGGVRYVPSLSQDTIRDTIRALCDELSDPGRILPGGFLYMSDLIASPGLMQRVGEIFATTFRSIAVDSVVTLETRGIPIALMTARALNVPLAIARRVSRVTEGTVVTVNYVSGSRRIETMSLSKRALEPGMRVLVIDDFMKAGSTARGLVDLISEFSAAVVGIGVLVETEQPRQKLVKEYMSLAVLHGVDEENRIVTVKPSAWVDA